MSTPIVDTELRALAVAVPSSGEPQLVRCGAELVELSERFHRHVFVAVLSFVGLSGTVALALLPLRGTHASYLTAGALLTFALVAATPLAVRHAHIIYLLLRRSHAAQGAVVVLAAVLVVYPLHSELWWPSCALLTLLATLVPLPCALGYSLVVLTANLLAHLIAGDLRTTAPVTIIGLWVGFVFWSAAFAVFTDRLGASVMRLNAHAARSRVAPLELGDVTVFTEPPGSPVPDTASATLIEPAAPLPSMRLTARQLQVVALLADGLRYDEVAACLAISVHQVQRHVSNAIGRLGLRNANELVALAVGEGLVPAR